MTDATRGPGSLTNSDLDEDLLDSELDSDGEGRSFGASTGAAGGAAAAGLGASSSGTYSGGAQSSGGIDSSYGDSSSSYSGQSGARAHLLQDGKDVASAKAEQAKQWASQQGDTLKQRVVEKPVESSIAVFGLGLIVGLLLRR